VGLDPLDRPIQPASLQKRYDLVLADQAAAPASLVRPHFARRACSDRLSATIGRNSPLPGLDVRSATALNDVALFQRRAGR
jgi:hypothetical protein